MRVAVRPRESLRTQAQVRCLDLMSKRGRIEFSESISGTRERRVGGEEEVSFGAPLEGA